MLFPLLSTLKLAAILQSQIVPTTMGEIVQNELNSTLDGNNGCWQIEGNAMDPLQLECCPPSHSPGLPSQSTSAPTKCRLQIDFAKLSICIQKGEFLTWPNAHQRCLDSQFRRILDKRIGGSNAAEFSISIGEWGGDSLLISELFNALHAHLPPPSVHSLEFILPSPPIPPSNFPSQIANLGLFFPRLQQLFIHSPFNPGEPRPKLFGRTFLRDLPILESLKVENVDFEFDQREEPQWLGHLERIHLENASFGDLPRWMAKCKRLERIFLLHCALNSSLSLSQLASAVQIKVNGNKIVDLHKVAFKCGRLHELDLRANSIPRIAPHSFSQCHSLRLLDLSENPFGLHFPDKPFFGCHRLKRLRLERIGLSHLRPEMFVGLANLKSLSLSGNPLSRIDPFTFLPTRSIRALSLANCSLHSLPLAVTQCCLLDSLSLDDNLFANRLSMPPELLALLSRLSHFSFQRNPLLQLPRGLFLYESRNEGEKQKLEQILNTLIHLPVWRLEPCTPFLWHFHLRNSSFPELRQKVAKWDEERMERGRLGHCKQLYETILEGIAIYRELLENSGCEASRRLRSVRAKENCAVPHRREEGTKSTQGNGPGIVQFLLAPASAILGPSPSPNLAPTTPTPPSSPIPHSPPPNGNFIIPTHFGLLHISFAANLFLLAFAFLLAAMKMRKILEEGNGRKKVPRREEFEEIY